MSEYRFRGTSVIAELLQQKQIRFHYDNNPIYESLEFTFPIQFGPLALVQFLVRNDRKLTLCVGPFFTHTPSKMRPRMMEAINLMNNFYDHLNLSLANSGAEVTATYDFPQMDNHSLRQAALQVLQSIVFALQEDYGLLCKAAFTNDPIQFDTLESMLPEDEIFDSESFESSLFQEFPADENEDLICQLNF